MADFQIDVCRESDLETALLLHEQELSPLHNATEYLISRNNFSDNLRAGRVFVARSGERIVGFAGYIQFADHQTMKQSIQNAITWARDKSKEPELLELMQKVQTHLGKGKAYAEVFENKATRSDLRISDTDVYFSQAAVHPDFRKRGIAEKLTLKKIEKSRELGASGIYVSCWEGGHVSKLYDKLGFLPILSAGPRYNDGSGEKVMVMLLKPPRFQRL